jgi:prenylcysteine oxidase/farnesylcysteine lyase
MFETVEDVTEITWDAFPRLDPRVEFRPFKFADGLYYVNAMESIVSTMETEVIGSGNVANLVWSDLSE